MMVRRMVASLVATLPVLGIAAGTPQQVPLRATGGAVVALWRKTPNPRKPHIAQWSGAHYFGLGMRILPAWANQGEFIWADDSIPPAVGREKVTAGDWCAFRNTIDGRPVTVLMVADPANPRPGEWFTMSRPFCYLSATLNLKNEPDMLAKDQTWTPRYGIAVLSSHADHARLAKLAAAWRTSASSNITKPQATAKP